MSTWCRVCGKTTFNEDLCDHCGKIPKEEEKTWNVPKNKGARIIKNAGLRNNTIKLDKNTIMTVAVVIIAISVGYLALNKYEENRQINEMAEIFLGTSDPDEIKAMIKKQTQQMKNMSDKMRRDSEQSIKKMNESLKNIGKM